MLCWRPRASANGVTFMGRSSAFSILFQGAYLEARHKWLFASGLGGSTCLHHMSSQFPEEPLHVAAVSSKTLCRRLRPFILQHAA